MKKKYLQPKFKFKFLQLFKQNNYNNLIFFFISQNSFSKNYRQFFAFFFKKYKLNNFSTRARFRCLLTNNPRVYHYKFFLSRHELRKNMLLGRIEGFFKSCF